MDLLNVGSSVYDSFQRKYTLEEIIGQGGFGYVFKAHRENDKAIFAVKTMLPSFNNLETAQSFINEINTALIITGENIIRYEYVHDGNEFSDLPPYIIMEYANGGTLRELLKHRQEVFKVNELEEIFRQLLNGMIEINKTLVHRDIKPENILFCDNIFKVSDFGLSKIASENTRTKSFKGWGSPLYMAPEAWDYSKNTIQMDIYSMGIVFYELASLHYPYNPKPTTYDECKETHLFAPIGDLLELNSKLPANMVSIINRMLKKPIQERFSNWHEILEMFVNKYQVDNEIDDIIQLAIKSRNAKDLAHQKQVSEVERKANEEAQFIKLVFSQVESVIITPINMFIDAFNSQYAGSKKIKLLADSSSRAKVWEMSISNSNSIDLTFEYVLKNSHTRYVNVDFSFDGNRTRTVAYTPQYKGKDILGWVEVSNSAGYGFNLLLVDSGVLYGDWIIMNNKKNMSNLSAGKHQRREPFAFCLSELPREIDLVQITHLYSATFDPYDEKEFITLIKQLAFDLTR